MVAELLSLPALPRSPAPMSPLVLLCSGQCSAQPSDVNMSTQTYHTTAFGGNMSQDIHTTQTPDAVGPRSQTWPLATAWRGRQHGLRCWCGLLTSGCSSLPLHLQSCLSLKQKSTPFLSLSPLHHMHACRSGACQPHTPLRKIRTILFSMCGCVASLSVCTACMQC